MKERRFDWNNLNFLSIRGKKKHKKNKKLLRKLTICITLHTLLLQNRLTNFNETLSAES